MVFEKNMVKKVYDYFETRGYQTFIEVPILRKTIDLLAFNKKNSVAVELKVKDWYRALQQVLTHQILVDYAYVAIWHEYLHRINVERFKQLGVGIINVGESAIIILNAKKSEIKEKSIEEKLIQTVRQSRD